MFIISFTHVFLLISKQEESKIQYNFSDNNSNKENLKLYTL